MNEPFVNPLFRNEPSLIGITRTIKSQVREVLMLPDDAVVAVSELACQVPGCPPKETVILVMQRGETMQFSIHKSIRDVTEEDLGTVLSAASKPD